MLVYVTGASGFVGRKLLPRLEAAAHPTIGVDVGVDVSDPDAVAIRLGTLSDALSQWQATLTQGMDRGVVVARRQVLAAIDQGRAWSSPDGFAEVAHLEGCAEPAVLARRAYSETADWLEREYLPHSAEADAVGSDRYLREASSHLGTVIEGLDRVDCCDAHLAYHGGVQVHIEGSHPHAIGPPQ